MEFYHINQISGRNEYIDFLRGVAALGIIAIHTAFWSGQSYTPEWFQNITLYLDVPFFFYLSGWGSSYRKSDVIKTAKSVLKVWCKWIFFISFLAVFCLLSQYVPVHFEGVKDVRDLFSNYMFNVSIPGFRVVAGSIWFMPYYIIVVVINALILMFIEKSTRESELKKFYAYSLVVIFLWISYDKYVFGLDLVYFVFYSFFWMLGMLRFGKVEKFWKFLLVVVICFAGIAFFSYLQELPFYDLQSAKFPPSLKYGVASLLIIFISKYMEGKIRRLNRFICHIGKNAIFYYFGQGISSSIIYVIVNRINVDEWFFKWLIMLIINIIITICIAEVLAIIYIVLENNFKIIKRAVRTKKQEAIR